MAFRPLEEVVGPVVLPIRGKNYTLPPVSLADGVAMHRAAAGGDTFPLKDLIRAILGDVKDQMQADGVPDSVIDRALWTGVADFQTGREAAELVWEHGVPKEILANLLAPLQDAMTQQAEASTTKQPGSGNGTTAKNSKGNQSRGRKSLTPTAGPSSSLTSPASTGSAFIKSTQPGPSSNT